MCTLSLSTLFYSLENHCVWLKKFTILRDMGLEQERALQQIFHFFLKQTIIHPLPILSMILLYLWCWRNICGLPVSCAMTQNSLNLVNKWENYWKVFDDRYMFDDGQFYLTLNQKKKFKDFSSCIAHLDSNKFACAIFYENCWTYVVVVIVIW
jgi:hypothetical protein